MPIIALLSLVFLLWLLFGLISVFFVFCLSILGFVVYKTGLLGQIRTLGKYSRYKQQMAIYRHCGEDEVSALKRMCEESESRYIPDPPKKSESHYSAIVKEAQDHNQHNYNYDQAKKKLTELGLWE